MIHSKAVARQDTAAWEKNCRHGEHGFDQCRIGFPWPEDGSNRTYDDEGWEYNCYVNPKVESYWAPLLKAKLIEQGFMNTESAREGK